MCTAPEPSWQLPANTIGGEFRLLSCSLNGFFACLLRFGSALAFGPYFLEFIVGEMLDTNEGILGGADTDQFVKLHLDGGAVPVLRVLDQKNHEEGDDGRTRVDDKLPRIGIMKNRPRYGPQEDDTRGNQKCECAARSLRRTVCDLAKQLCGSAITRSPSTS